jgi:hypothetical protein
MKVGNLSAADELLKWIKLKEEGYISEEEFHATRRKTLEQT